MVGISPRLLKGRLVHDSEIRDFQNGGKILSNAMALSRVWYDNNGANSSLGYNQAPQSYNQAPQAQNLAEDLDEIPF